MSNVDLHSSVEIVIDANDLTEALDCYTRELGFRIDMIFPADSPRLARLSGYGIQLRLARANDGPAAKPELPQLVPSVVVQKFSDHAWGTGRAGMQYRDLIPNRHGGRYIASHIRIATGGPVADYVHHHHVRFQMVYCYKGWVKVVYEDQGQPFVMHAGDCVLQPPHIRHRVLECSDQMEVIEITCPAEHETHVDHAMKLPTSAVLPEREYNGQRFVYHQHENGEWRPARMRGFDARDLGIGGATNARATARVLRPCRKIRTAALDGHGDFLFHFVLRGELELRCADGRHWSLSRGDTFVVPADTKTTLADLSADLEILQVAAP